MHPAPCMETQNTTFDLERCLDMAAMLNRSSNEHYDRERNKQQILSPEVLWGQSQWWTE